MARGIRVQNEVSVQLSSRNRDFNCTETSFCEPRQRKRVRIIAQKASLAYANPKAKPMRRTTNAATHATAHWNTMIPSAHFHPSSRLMDATAAMHGV